MKIILGNEEIKKIIEGYAYSEFPAKEPEVVITNKRNGVEISINLSDKKNESRDGSVQDTNESLSQEDK
mgnify:FL=1